MRRIYVALSKPDGPWILFQDILVWWCVFGMLLLMARFGGMARGL